MDTIVDGYNLIFECGLAGRYRSAISLERARKRLVDSIVASLPEPLRRGITIVYDAKRLPRNETEAVSQEYGITIIFAVDYDDADSLIEQLVRKNSNPKQLTVVSSDHRLHKAALRRKATPIDSDVWFDRLESMGRQFSSMFRTNENRNDKPDVGSLNDIDWASEFESTEPPIAADEKKTIAEMDETFNPFPPGYAEDLLNEEGD